MPALALGIRRPLVASILIASTAALPHAHARAAMQMAWGLTSTAAPAANTTTPAASAPPGNSPAPTVSSVPPPGSAVPAPTGGAVPAAATANAAAINAMLQAADYANNMKSEVFGANLFTGAFAGQGASQFNPDYALSTSDNIQVRFWGAFEFDGVLTVDPKGNIFLPRVGPVSLLGVRNRDLQRVVETAAARVFRANVYSYASLAASQPVRVFVGGFVNRPGLYGGTSMDSLLHYLDLAGGIDPERGSFLNIQIKRGGMVRVNANLYDFLLEGRMPLIQFADGDVIFVTPRQNNLKTSGLVDNAKYFEFPGQTSTVGTVALLAKPKAQATHVRVVRNSLTVRSTEYYPLATASNVQLQNGDELEFTSDKLPGTISVRVEGEHLSPQEYVLPYGSRIGDVMKQIKFSERSDVQSIQLFRTSVKERQKAMLQTSLNSLQNAALTARSGTNDEAILRKTEAELLLQWVDRARQIEPPGQVLVAQPEVRDALLLENGDIIRVPTQDGLVLISGEILFPNAIAFNSAFGLDDYIKRAGGYTQNADVSRLVIAHRDGSFDEVQDGSRSFGSASIRQGDQILVLPKIDEKNRQIWKDLTQIIFQIAVSAKVVLGL